jgi:hypothetical protein
MPRLDDMAMTAGLALQRSHGPHDPPKRRAFKPLGNSKHYPGRLELQARFRSGLAFEAALAISSPKPNVHYTTGRLNGATRAGITLPFDTCQVAIVSQITCPRAGTVAAAARYIKGKTRLRPCIFVLPSLPPSRRQRPAIKLLSHYLITALRSRSESSAGRQGPLR